MGWFPMMPIVSIIIPAYNEEKIISGAIQSMLKQKYPRKEIIVMDNASTDKTYDIVKKHRVRVIRNKKNIGIGNSVNRGIRSSKGEFFIILHADHKTEDLRWIEKMISPFSDPKVAVVVSRRINKDRSRMSLGEKLYDSLHPPTYGKRSGLEEVSILREKADAYRKKIVKKVGYFDGNSFPHGGEDVDMSMKLRHAGYKIILNNDAVVEHIFSSHQSSLYSVFKKGFQMGAAGTEIQKRYGIDSIRRRLFLMIFASILLLPLSGSMLGIIPYCILFLLGIFSFITVSGSLKVPVSSLSLLMILALISIGYGFSSVGYGVALASMTVLAYFGIFSVKNSIKAGDGLHEASAIFFLSILWRLVSSLGYAKESILPSEI